LRVKKKTITFGIFRGFHNYGLKKIHQFSSDVYIPEDYPPESEHDIGKSTI